MAGYDYESKAVRAAMENYEGVMAGRAAGRILPNSKPYSAPASRNVEALIAKVQSGTATPNELEIVKGLQLDWQRIQDAPVKAQWGRDVADIGDVRYSTVLMDPATANKWQNSQNSPGNPLPRNSPPQVRSDAFAKEQLIKNLEKKQLREDIRTVGGTPRSTVEGQYDQIARDNDNATAMVAARAAQEIVPGVAQAAAAVNNANANPVAMDLDTLRKWQQHNDLVAAGKPNVTGSSSFSPDAYAWEQLRQKPTNAQYIKDISSIGTPWTTAEGEWTTAQGEYDRMAKDRDKRYDQIARDNDNAAALVEAKKRDALPTWELTLPTKKLDVVAAPTQQVVEPGVAQIAAADIIHQAPATASVQASTVVAPSSQTATKTAPKARPAGTAPARYNNGNLSKAQVMDMQRILNRDTGSTLAIDGKLGPATQGVLQGYRNNEAEKQLVRDSRDMGLAEGWYNQAQSPVAQQVPVQQPSFLGMKLDQQATEAAWDKWRSNDAPEGYIPTAVYR